MDGCNLQNQQKKIEKRKNHRRILNFKHIFQSFRKSYVLVPSYGERKWRQKSGKKTLTEGFLSKKHTENRNFGGEKDTLRKESPVIVRFSLFFNSI